MRAQALLVCVLLTGCGMGRDPGNRNSELTPGDGGDSGAVSLDASLPDVRVWSDAATEQQADAAHHEVDAAILGEDASDMQVDTECPPCELQNAEIICVHSQCEIASCQFGYANCDSRTQNGCETSLRTNEKNCGSCNAVCEGGQVCADGVCVTIGATCDQTHADCDNNSDNGCETDLLSDSANCGRCGASCVAPKANQYSGCTNGHCLFPDCLVGYGDCDGNGQNGCETDVRTDSENCGGCGVRCEDGKICTDGACVGASTACDETHADCDGDPDNGCETDLSSDDANCGRCGASCIAPKANQYGGCTNGHCLFPDCLVGYGDCDGNGQNGCETNVRTDAKNCGGCGVRCEDGKACVDADCVSAPG